MTPDIRSAVVTGAASGIGRALVMQLVSEGASVVAVDVNEDALRSLADEVEVETACVDVADRQDNEALAERVGALDLPCLNAGVASQQALPVWTTPDQEWSRACCR